MFKNRTILLKYGKDLFRCYATGSGAPPLHEKLRLKKVLIVSKLSRYEFEKYRNKHLSEKDLEKDIISRGSDYENILRFHREHKAYEENVVDSLKRIGSDVRVVNRLSYNDDCVKGVDIVIPVGGDGTFLLAASRVRDSTIPVVGLNSDPNRSEGHLCLPKRFSSNVTEALDRLITGNFDWLLRNRIRATVIGQEGKFRQTNLHEIGNSIVITSQAQILPYLGLNEVFIGETLSAKVSHLDIWLDDQSLQTSVKCSGLCVCTGTGSSSWHTSINRLSTHSVAELLRFLDMSPTEDENSMATLLSDMYNRSLLFPPTHNEVAYTVRDLISAGVWPKPKGIKPRGFAKRIRVQSRCYDASLVIDGGVSFAFNTFATVSLEIHPEDALRTVQLNE